MANKKGVEDIVQNILLGAVAGIFFLLIFLVAFKAMGAILPKTGPEAQCSNSQWWDNPRALKDVLKGLDSDETSAEFLFYNDNCNLVSFSFAQGVNPIQYTGVQPREPMLCLCEIERSTITRDAECKRYGCYKFKNYDQINAQQLSTEDFEPYTLLRFRKDGRVLRIDAIGTEKNPEPLVYTKPQTPNILDQTGLIRKLEVIFETRQIKAFTPIVTVKEPGFLIPGGVPNIPNFTKIFDIELVQPAHIGQSIEDYAANHQDLLIDPNLVRKALIEFSISKENFVVLTEYQRNNLVLYYKLGQSWEMSPLKCTETETEVICGTIMNGFSTNFAISIIRVGDAYTSESEKEFELTQFIIEKSLANNIDPLFVKSIIKIESDWTTRSVSSCGAGGIIQIMPHTARGLGLSTVLDTVDGVSFSTTASCTNNEPYGTALKQFVDRTTDDQELALLDERFNDTKAIAAAIQYFVRIRNYLESKGIPVTRENMAAAYQAGPGNVIGDNNYKTPHASVYVSRFKQVYSNLQQHLAMTNEQVAEHELEDEETQVVQTIALVQEGPCRGLVGGLVPIPQDSKIRCADSICCTRPETLAKIEHTKQFIDTEDKVILIVDAARSPSSQRRAYLEYLAGRVPACGPNGISREAKRELREKVPNIEAPREERIRSAEEWLAANDPRSLAIINDLSQYSGCRHIQGRALDVRLLRGTSEDDRRDLRNLMCEAGWANLGIEWWHYEYQTTGYTQARASNQCYFGNLEYASTAATVNPGYV